MVTVWWKISNNHAQLYIGDGFQDTRLAYKISSTDATLYNELCPDHEEADMQMALNTAHAFSCTGNKLITINSPHTDVFLWPFITIHTQSSGALFLHWYWDTKRTYFTAQISQL